MINQFAENGTEHCPCKWWGSHSCWREVIGDLKNVIGLSA